MVRSKLYTVIIITSFVILFLQSVKPSFAALTLKPEIERLFLDGVVMAFHDQFYEAQSKFDSVCTLDKVSPIGHFCKAFVYDLFMDEYRSLKFMKEFEDEVAVAIKMGETQVAASVQTPETFLFTGGVYGIRGVRKAMLGDWWGAFKDALKGIAHVRKSIEMDSTMYDAYYGIGNYDYWKSVRTKGLWWLPFVSDKREQGFQELYLSIEKGKFVPLASRTALLRIYVEEKRYQDCIKIADELIKDYNRDLHPLWFKGYSLIKLKQWKEADEIYKNAFKLLTSKDFHGPAGKAESWYYQALCAYNLGDKEQAKSLLSQVFPLRGQINEKIFFYENIFDEALKLQNEIDGKKSYN